MTKRASDGLTEQQARDLLDQATMFDVVVSGCHVLVTRYDNHGDLIANGTWAAVCTLGGWYKVYTSFRTPTQAIEAARQAIAHDATRRDAQEVPS